jgi:hypothetical protein
LIGPNIILPVNNLTQFKKNKHLTQNNAGNSGTCPKESYTYTHIHILTHTTHSQTQPGMQKMAGLRKKSNAKYTECVQRTKHHYTNDYNQACLLRKNMLMYGPNLLRPAPPWDCRATIDTMLLGPRSNCLYRPHLPQICCLSLLMQ